MVETTTEVIFVEVTASLMEMRACEIAERIYAQGGRLQIVAADQKQATRLDNLLWNFKPGSFVPHGLFEKEKDDHPQPVVITIRPELIPTLDSLLMMNYCPLELVSQFSQVIHLVVVDDPERLEASRSYWSQLREAGLSLRHQKRSPVVPVEPV